MLSSIRSYRTGVAGGCLLLAVGWFILTGSATAPAAPQGKGKPSTIKLCITFDDLDADRIKSDGFGDYCRDKKEKIAAAFGDFFRLQTNYTGAAGGRTLFFDFTEPAEMGTTPPFPSGYPIEATVFASLPASDMEQMVIGTTRMIPIRFHFPTDPKIMDLSWHVVFGQPAAGAVCPAGSPSNEVQLSKIDADTWRIETLAAGQDIACLLLGGECNGHFHMPFGMTLKRIP